MERLGITKPRLAVWLLVALTIPWQLGGQQPVAVLVDYLLLILVVFLLWRTPGIRSYRWRGWQLLPLGLLSWGAMSLVWSVNRYQTLIWLEVLGLAIAAFWVVQSFAHDDDLRGQWLLGYQGVAGLAAVWGLIIYLTQSYNRLTSSFYLANPFAAYILPALVIAIWQFAKHGKKFSAVVAPILLATFILADSRTAFIVAAVAVVAAAGSRLPVKSWLRMGIVVALGLSLVLAANLARNHVFHHNVVTAGSRFAEAGTGESTSASDRLNYLKSTLAIWRHYPLLGTGAGTFETVHPQYQYRVISAASQAHNYYAQTVSELGLGGLLFLAGLVVALILVIIKRFQTRSGQLLALVLGIMVVHLALDIDAVYPVIMVAIGSVAALVVPLPKDHPDQPGWSLALAGLLTLVLLVPAYFGYVSSRSAAFGATANDQIDFTQAAADYAKAHSDITYDPDTLTAEGIDWYTLAGLSSKTQGLADYNQAQKLALAAIMLDPLDSQHEFLYARVQFKEGNIEAATAAYKRAIELDPYNHPEYYADLANLYVLHNQFAAAAAVTNTVIAEYPPDVVSNRSIQPNLTTTLAVLYYFRAVAEQVSQPSQVKPDLRASVKLDPSNQAASQLLAALGG